MSKNPMKTPLFLTLDRKMPMFQNVEQIPTFQGKHVELYRNVGFSHQVLKCKIVCNMPFHKTYPLLPCCQFGRGLKQHDFIVTCKNRLHMLHCFHCITTNDPNRAKDIVSVIRALTNLDASHWKKYSAHPSCCPLELMLSSAFHLCGVTVKFSDVAKISCGALNSRWRSIVEAT